MSADDIMSEENERVTAEPRMTKTLLKQLCRKHQLYLSPALNDVLYLHYQGFSKIENLEEYTNLKCLWLQNNNLSDVSTGLEHLTSLRALHLHNNRIMNVKGLYQLKSLVTLNLCHNFLTGLEGIDRLPHLQTLQLSHNRLRDTDTIRVLTWCPALSCVDVSHNRLHQPDVTDVFACMPQLRVLQVNGNPCVQQVPHYRNSVTARCPLLTYLDDRPVFPVDRAAAEAWAVGGEQAERAAREEWMKREHERVANCVNDVIRLQERVRRAKRNLSSPSSSYCSNNHLSSTTVPANDSLNDDDSVDDSMRPTSPSDGGHQGKDQGVGEDEHSCDDRDQGAVVLEVDQGEHWEQGASTCQGTQNEVNASTWTLKTDDGSVWTQEDMGISVVEYGDEKIYALTPEAKLWAKKKIEMMKLRDKEEKDAKERTNFAETNCSIPNGSDCGSLLSESLERPNSTISDIREEDCAVSVEMNKTNEDVADTDIGDLQVNDHDQDNCEDHQIEHDPQDGTDDHRSPSKQEYNDAFMKFLKSISPENSLLLKQAIANVSGKSSFDEENQTMRNDDSDVIVTSEENTKSVENFEISDEESSEVNYSYDTRANATEKEGNFEDKSKRSVWDTIEIKRDDSAEAANSMDSDIEELMSNLETSNICENDGLDFLTAEEVENRINEYIDGATAKTFDASAVRKGEVDTHFAVDDSLDSDDDDSLPSTSVTVADDQDGSPTSDDGVISNKSGNDNRGIDHDSLTRELNLQFDEEKCQVVAKNNYGTSQYDQNLAAQDKEVTNCCKREALIGAKGEMLLDTYNIRERGSERFTDNYCNEQDMSVLKRSKQFNEDGNEIEQEKKSSLEEHNKKDIEVNNKKEQHFATRNSNKERPIGCQIRNDCSLCGNEAGEKVTLTPSGDGKLSDPIAQDVQNFEINSTFGSDDDTQFASSGFETLGNETSKERLDDAVGNNRSQLKLLSEISRQEIQEDFRNVLQEMGMSGESLHCEAVRESLHCEAVRETQELIKEFPLLTGGADTQTHSGCIGEVPNHDGVPLTNYQEIHLLSKLLSCGNPDGTRTADDSQLCSEYNTGATQSDYEESSLTENNQFSTPTYYGPTTSSNRPNLDRPNLQDWRSNHNSDVKLRNDEEFGTMKTLKLPNGRFIKDSETAKKNDRPSVKLAWAQTENGTDSNDVVCCIEPSQSCGERCRETKDDNVRSVERKYHTKHSSNLDELDWKRLNKRGRASNSFTRDDQQKEEPEDLDITEPSIPGKSLSNVNQTNFIYEEQFCISPGHSQEQSGSSLFPKLVNTSKTPNRVQERGCLQRNPPVEASKELLNLENVLKGKESSKSSSRKIVYQSTPPKGKMTKHQAAASGANNSTSEQRQKKGPSAEGVSPESTRPLIQELI